MKKNTSRGSVALTEHQVSSLFFSESRTMSLIRNVFKRLNYPVDIIAQCVRGYLAYALSLRNLEEMMAERGIAVDHSTLFRWVHRWVPLIVKRYRRSKPEVERRWRMDETYIKIKGQWRYLYRAVNSNGNTVEFLLTAHRDKKAALRFFKKAMRQHGQPDGVTLDKSGANKAALDEINKEKLKNITTTNHSIHDLIFK
ncbi:transposase (fragment) [Xenorhabdus bovienii str. feltiae Florida]